MYAVRQRLPSASVLLYDTQLLRHVAAVVDVLGDGGQFRREPRGDARERRPCGLEGIPKLKSVTHLLFLQKSFAATRTAAIATPMRISLVVILQCRA
ncbi:MAG: hypothetical protein ACO1Q7_02065 [Gemmatimonas sp.]